jgi:hypothetical protein
MTMIGQRKGQWLIAAVVAAAAITLSPAQGRCDSYSILGILVELAKSQKPECECCPASSCCPQGVCRGAATMPCCPMAAACCEKQGCEHCECMCVKAAQPTSSGKCGDPCCPNCAQCANCQCDKPACTTIKPVISGVTPAGTLTPDLGIPINSCCDHCCPACQQCTGRSVKPTVAGSCCDHCCNNECQHCECCPCQTVTLRINKAEHCGSECATEAKLQQQAEELRRLCAAHQQTISELQGIVRDLYLEISGLRQDIQMIHHEERSHFGVRHDDRWQFAPSYNMPRPEGPMMMPSNIFIVPAVPFGWTAPMPTSGAMIVPAMPNSAPTIIDRD